MIHASGCDALGGPPLAVGFQYNPKPAHHQCQSLLHRDHGTTDSWTNAISLEHPPVDVSLDSCGSTLSFQSPSLVSGNCDHNIVPARNDDGHPILLS
jgi:hypothetical protein